MSLRPGRWEAAARPGGFRALDVGAREGGVVEELEVGGNGENYTCDGCMAGLLRRIVWRVGVSVSGWSSTRMALAAS